MFYWPMKKGIKNLINIVDISFGDKLKIGHNQCFMWSTSSASEKVIENLGLTTIVAKKWSQL